MMAGSAFRVLRDVDARLLQGTNVGHASRVSVRGSCGRRVAVAIVKTAESKAPVVENVERGMVGLGEACRQDGGHPSGFPGEGECRRIGESFRTLVWKSGLDPRMNVSTTDRDPD